MKKKWKVDVLTTYCHGEPKEMVMNTLQAIKNIRYPHKTFLCDEANDAEMKRFCEELDIIHVIRDKKINAKAGNINNALNTVASGEICLILDPDHIPFPNFLDEVLPFFEDKNIGFVQVPQVYYNQKSTVIAKAAAQQTYKYYGPFMMGLNSLGAVTAIGANCTFLRAALDSIGGHAPGLTEDMHTAMLLHSKKWKSVYNPVVVAKGLVPWNYSGYCLQQLKWSRGSFDLFFKVIPRIYKNLTWKQLVFYCAAPLFYLMGLFSFFDFIIPIIALMSGLVPIKISIENFAVFYFQYFLAGLIVRQYFQRWLLEKHEKGVFIFGGILFKVSWWASLLGLIYAVINKKVPYIPTPKDNSYETPLKLLIPNFVLIACSLVAIVYGLTNDFNHFMLFMAFLAFLNVCILSLGSIMAMQHLIIRLHEIFKGSFISKGSNFRLKISHQRQIVFGFLQRRAVPLIIILPVTFIALRLVYLDIKENRLRQPAFEKLYIPNLYGLTTVEYDTNCHFIYDTLRLSENFLSFAKELSEFSLKNDKMPFCFIKIEPKQIDEILLNKWDTIFLDFFTELREIYRPVFISILTDGLKTDSTSIKLAKCLTRLTILANDAYFPNIAWVWQSDNPYNDTLVSHNRYSIAWILSSTDNLNNQENAVPPDQGNQKPILAHENGRIFTFKPTRRRYDIISFHPFDNNNFETSLSGNFNTIGKPGNFIKGVAYNPGHDWRDNKNTIPLTSKKLENDFQSIKDMGANTIRRYKASLDDRKILRIAEKTELMVLYGFHFDSKIDYYKNQRRINRYKKRVLKYVERHGHNQTILGWTLGNEAWGLLKNHFNEPYLSFVRQSYVNMIGRMAEEVRKVDTIHPIFVAEEHTSHMPAAIYAFERYAPAINVYGINSYYEQNIGLLDSIMSEIPFDKPYIVSEFGPKGYWHEEFNDYYYDQDLYEQNSMEKARFFVRQWQNYIHFENSRNIGGIAFCWQYRYEGTATWFGITDIFDNRTPSWYALNYCFQNKDTLIYPVPAYHILPPTDPIQSSGTARVLAATRNLEERVNHYFKWMILEEDTYEKIMETPFTKGEFTIEIKAPRKKSKYRLYLYVSDNKGNVVTESCPIQIQW